LCVGVREHLDNSNLDVPHMLESSAHSHKTCLSPTISPSTCAAWPAVLIGCPPRFLQRSSHCPWVAHTIAAREPPISACSAPCQANSIAAIRFEDPRVPFLLFIA
jgi:hypothetical protein